jgi:hypothetical protein
MSEITSQYIELHVEDGTTMRAWFALPKDKAPRALQVPPEN